MTTEQEQAINRSRMWALTVMGMAVGVWDLVEESANSLSPIIGEQILVMAEKLFDLNFEGETPEKLMSDLGFIFVDKFGFCTAIEVESSDKTIIVTGKNSVGIAELKAIKERGVAPFIHPFLCTGLAGLARLGLRARAQLEISPNQQDIIIKFTLVK